MGLSKLGRLTGSAPSTIGGLLPTIPMATPPARTARRVALSSVTAIARWARRRNTDDPTCLLRVAESTCDWVMVKLHLGGGRDTLTLAMGDHARPGQRARFWCGPALTNLGRSSREPRRRSAGDRPQAGVSTWITWLPSCGPASSHTRT